MKSLFAVIAGIGIAAAASSTGQAAIPDWVHRLGWMLVHSVWELTLIALAAALLDRLLRRRTADARYAAGVAALALVVAVPAMTWGLIDSRTESTAATTVVADADRAEVSSQFELRAGAEGASGTFDAKITERQPPDGWPAGDVLPPQSPGRMPDDLVDGEARPMRASSWLASVRAAIEPRLPIIVVVWVIGVLLFAIRPACGLWMQFRLRSSGLSRAPEAVERVLAELARVVGLRRTVAISVSVFARVPMAVGWLKPVILLPASVVTGLSSDQLRAVVAHELAHIRRHDWLVNAVQVAVETLLFFHPAVWWLSRRIRQEREHCCDDLALALVGDRATYGRMLLALAESRVAVPEPVLTATGGTLLFRVRRLFPKPNAEESATRGWLAGLVLLAIVGAGITLVATPGARSDQADVTDDDSVATDAATVDNATPTDLAELVARVRENEALFRNLDATIKTSWEFRRAAGGGEGAGATKAADSFGEGGPNLLEKTEETHHLLTRGDQFHFTSESLTSMTSGAALSGKERAVCDGQRTIAIADGNSATVFEGRHEPAAMSPPHAWGLFAFEVNFPLSVYLEGTEAMKRHSKVRRLPVEHGSIYEFYKVESEVLGEESLGELACVKVKVRRWYYTKDQPVLQTLWLAKDRNYHVAQCQSSWTRNGAEVPGDAIRVMKWRALTRGVWIPAVVTSERFELDGQGKKSKTPQWTRRLFVANAALNPTPPAELFALPKPPASLPVFAVSSDGRLTGGPLHPAPAAADPGTTLESIIARVADEEAKYGSYEVTATGRYEMLNRAEMGPGGGGVIQSTDSRERSVIAGSRAAFEQEETSKSGAGQSLSTHREAFDGKVRRQLNRFTSSVGNRPENVSASVSFGGSGEMLSLRAHSALFHGERGRQSLAEFLKSGWLNRRYGSRMTVEYVGDERIGEWHCHKLKCDMPRGSQPVPDPFFFLWLARDRNLAPVRQEWYQPARSETLPGGMTYVSDLREIRPGVWFPYGIAQLTFQSLSREGLNSNRPLLQWRKDLRVESLALDPAVDDALFTRIDVPAGTSISVQSETGQSIGHFKQPRDGNVDVRPEELPAMRLSARVEDKDEIARRKAALDALIGKEAPALPKNGWLNSKPLAWNDLAGKTVVVEFWSHWSYASDAELKRLAEVRQAWLDDGVTGRVILGIHTAGTGRETIARLVEEKQLGFPIVIDAARPDGGFAWGDLFDAFAVRQIPVTVVVDGAGRIVANGRLEDMLAKAAELGGTK